MNLYETAGLAIPVFAASALESVVLNRGTLSMLTKQPKSAAINSLAFNLMSWVKMAAVIKWSEWDIALMISDGVGDVIGDYIAAHRGRKNMSWELLKQISISLLQDFFYVKQNTTRVRPRSPKTKSNPNQLSRTQAGDP